MKRLLSITLALFMTCSAGYCAEPEYDQSQEVALAEETKYTGFGPGDGYEEAVATSMVGWGLGMAIAIAVIAGVIKQSTSDDDSTSPSHAHAHSQ